MTIQSAIAFALSRKAAWRRERAQRYPGNWRNVAAAEQLELLAAQADATDADPELLERYERLAGDGELDENHVNEVMNSIGFGRARCTLDGLLRAILAA
jgi:hypothetical protein